MKRRNIEKKSISVRQEEQINPIIDKIFHSSKEKKDLCDHLIQQINHDIDEYSLDVNDFLKRYEKVYKFEKMFLFIIYKKKEFIIVYGEGDSRKTVIIENVKNTIERLEKKFGDLPDLFLPFYVSDTHFYHDNEIPFFVEAKPKNAKGILYPDKDFYKIKMENKDINYDQLKTILKKHDCTQYSKKEPLIYFSGANTGADKHNIRMKLKEISFENQEKNKNYELYVSEQYVPLYDFCKYKYLLNLPGHQPWSYRMSKILLMGSLVIDINIIQTYLIETKEGVERTKNEKWIQLFTSYFKEGEDFVEITYPWLAGVQSDRDVLKIYEKINEIYQYYQKNTNEYKRITENAVKKTDEIDMKIINSSFEYAIFEFNKRLYEKNSKKEIEHFMNYFIKLTGREVLEIDEMTMKIMDIDSGFKIQQNFFKDNLSITPKKVYDVLLLGGIQKDKVKIIYDNIIKFNKLSHLNIISYDKKSISLKDYTQISYIQSIPILALLQEAEYKKKYQFIFIFEEKEYKDLFQELSFSWNILEYGGYIIVDLFNIEAEYKSIDNYEYFKTFRGIYSQEILLFEKVGKRVIIQKYKKNHKIIDVPESVQTLIKKYIDTFPEERKLYLPPQKKERIHWNFIFSNQKPKDIPENEIYIKSQNKIHKYHKQFNHEFEKKIDRFDLNYFWNVHHQKFISKLLENIVFIVQDLFGEEDKNINEFVKKIYDILNFEKIFYAFNPEKIEDMIKKCKKGVYSGVRLRQPLPHSEYLYQFSELMPFLEKTKSALYIDYSFPINQEQFKNKDPFKGEPSVNPKYMKYRHIKMDTNYFGFENLVELSKQYKNKLDYIEIELKNVFVHRFFMTPYTKEELNMYVYIHMLYFILSVQKKDGILVFNLVPFTNLPQIQILQILNNYYDECYIKTSNDFKHKDTSTLVCKGFRGIEKEELDEFYTSYKEKYDHYVKNKKNLWRRQFKNENENVVKNRVDKSSFLYINQIFSNPTHHQLQKDVFSFYSSYFKEINQNLEDKLIIDDIMRKSSKEVQKYIFLTLFNQQYIRFIEFVSNRKKEMLKLFEKCKKS